MYSVNTLLPIFLPNFYYTLSQPVEGLTLAQLKICPDKSFRVLLEFAACKSVITFCLSFVFCSSLSVDLFSGKKKFWHGNQLLELFSCSYALLQKNKKLLLNLGYIFVFLQKWITTREKFKKLITVGHFYFFSDSRRIDPRSRMSRKQKISKML